MSAPPREFMTADEAAAETSATHDVHVDCAQATLKQVAVWWGVPPDRLIRFDTPEVCPANGIVCDKAPGLAAVLGHTATAHRVIGLLLRAGIATPAAAQAATNEELLDIRLLGFGALRLVREHFPHVPPGGLPVKIHPRMLPVSAATAELKTAVLDHAEKHDLTDVEMLRALQDCELMFTTRLLRTERHPDDPERKADEA